MSHLATTIANYNALKAAKASREPGCDQIQRVMAIRALKDFHGGAGTETAWFVEHVLAVLRAEIDKAIDQFNTAKIEALTLSVERFMAHAALGERPGEDE